MFAVTVLPDTEPCGLAGEFFGLAAPSLLGDCCFCIWNERSFWY